MPTVAKLGVLMTNSSAPFDFVHFSVAADSLGGYSNVVLAGAQPYTSLPDWALAFDVAILPYRSLDRGAMNANLLKLREYLATGKPVVAVSTPEIERFSHCIRIAHSHRDFLQEVEDALANDSDADRQKRMREVMDSTWEARVATVIQSVQMGFGRKKL